MSQPIDREGTFRGVITAYGLKEMDSGAVAVSVKVSLTQMWTGHEWCDWSQYDMDAEGDIWIVKKDGGGVNEKAAQSLISFAGWDGNLMTIIDEKWEPSPCGLSIVKDEYKGNTRFRISFINDYERTPGGMTNVSPEKIRELATRYGSQFRALAGNRQRNAAPASGRPAPPPPPPPTRMAPAPSQDNDEIPF